MGFEPNYGQAGRGVAFLARGHGYSIALTPMGAILTFNMPGTGLPRIGLHGGFRSIAAAPSRRAAVQMTLVGAVPPLGITGLDKLPGRVNYVIGRDPRAWRTGVATYAVVRYAQVYPGVDLVFHGNQGRLEYDFVLAANADPRHIRLAFAGGGALGSDAAGNLLLHPAVGMLCQQRPLIYQETGGVRRPIAGGYRLLNDHEVAFRLGAYDRSRPLVIDPAVVYATYLGYHGGAGDDSAAGVQVDAAGAAYVVGTTNSGLSHQAIFVAKLDPSGTKLLYTTLVSDECDAQAGNIALDRAGNAYITGLYTSKDKNGICIVVQVVVAKLSPSGAPLYNVRFGRHSEADFQAKDWGNGIAVDGQGNAYVTGETDMDSGFPTTPGAFQRTRPAFNEFTAFVLKVNGSGALVYATYLSGSKGSGEHGTAVAVDGQGEAYVTGHTASSDFPTTPNAYQRTLASHGDLGAAFLTKLNAAGSALIYSTYLTGGGAEEGRGIAVDAAGNAYITGVTDTPRFPTTPDAYSRSCGGDNACGLGRSDQAGCVYNCMFFNDAFVAEIDPQPALPAKRTLVYSTYLGGALGDGGNGIAVDGAHHVYVTGVTNSVDFPVVDATQPTRNGAGNALAQNDDAFVAKLDLGRSGHAALVFSTYFGGSGNDTGNGIAIDHGGNIYVAGTTRSPDLPTRSPEQGKLGGGTDAFLVKFDTTAPAPPQAGAALAIHTVWVGHQVNGQWTPTALVHLSESTIFVVFYRGPGSGAAVIGTMKLTYHGKWSQTFSLVPYQASGGYSVLGQTISWLQHSDNLGKVHVEFTLSAGAASATKSTDFTLAS